MKNNSLLVEDEDRAAENRKRIADGFAQEYWDTLERRVRNLKPSDPIPADIPIGEERT